MHARVLEWGAYLANIFSGQTLFSVWVALAPIHSDVMAFIPGNHKDTIQRLCFYNQKLGAPLFFLLFFPIKATVFHSPLSVKDCFLSAVSLLQCRLQPSRVSLQRKTFSPLDSSTHN